MGGSGRAKRAMPTLAAKSAARMGHPDCAASGKWLAKLLIGEWLPGFVRNSVARLGSS